MIPALPLDTSDTVTLAVVAGAPPSVSLTSTFDTAVPPVPAVVVAPASLVATITPALTGTVTLAWSQLVGALVSQISYTSTYMPAGVPGATETAPVAVSSVTPALVLEMKRVVTLLAVTATPARVSLLRTLGTATPPAADVVTTPVSSTATMAPAVNGTAGAVALLFAAFGSVPPAGACTVAVLAPTGVAVVAGAVPLTSIRVVAPLARVTSAVTVLPDGAAATQPASTHVIDTAVSSAGSVSLTCASATGSGPLLVTVNR